MHIPLPQSSRQPSSEAAVESLVHDPLRLAVVRESGLLDSAPEAAFDAMTRLAAKLLNVPFSFMSVMDAGRVFYKSHCGFPAALAQARELDGRTFCHYTLDSTMPLVIEDTHAHPVWKAVPMVASLGVRAYVGFPLRVDAHNVGCFCVGDVKPRNWTAEELDILQQLAASAGRELKLRATVKAAELLSAQVLERTAELDLARQEADLANLAKSTFLAAMSHEIRTPIHGMLGTLEILNQSRLGTFQRASLTTVNESCTALLRVIEDIFELARLEAGDLALAPEAASVGAIVDGVFGMFSGDALSKGLVLERNCDPRISQALMVDPRRLRQILENFVRNALAFTAKGTVSIAAQWLGRLDGMERIRLVVDDTRVCIPEQDLKQLLAPVGQVQNPARGSATGVGLMICHRLAELMGGTVEIVNAPGGGTMSSLTLSLAVADAGHAAPTHRGATLAPAAAAPQRTAPGIAQAELEGTLVLLVDDYPINRKLLLRQVNLLGYAAETAEDGVAALEKWKSGRFGLVITDCNMPHMDGYELTRAIRRIEADEGLKRIPIVACTARELANEAQVCLAAGMDDFLTKPTSLSVIGAKLNQWLPVPEFAAFEARRQFSRLRHSAEERLENGTASFTSGWPLGTQALVALDGLASAPASVSDALKLLHELQVNRIEFDLQHEQAEEQRCQLTEDLAHYATKFELAPFPYLSVDTEGRVIAANRLAESLAPGSGESHEWTGRRVEDLLAPESRAAFRGMLAELRKGKGRQTCEVQLRADGTSARAVANATPGGGQVLMAFVPAGH